MVKMLPYIRRIDISDMHGQLVVVTRIDGQVEYVHLVASVTIDRGVVMQTGSVNEARLEGRLVHAPTDGVSFTYRCVDRVVRLLPYIDMYVMNTVVALYGLLAVLVVSGCGDVVQTAPGVRYIVLTNVDRVIRNTVRLMDIQGQAVDTVAT